ncbi:hypothetical protein LZ554_006568 [Drepanopeziza brunnea f. sp. 'monogermtubi']|nr:hypothetical protein LZ554_006568 [Drepanopeziza brunnea f. sp. 'monogermtubi']
MSSYQFFNLSYLCPLGGSVPYLLRTSLKLWTLDHVLKSEREKKWWLGDGLDLVNKAKAIGYEGSSKKYDVILWLRNTPEEVDGETEHVAAPTDNKAANEEKRKPEGEPVKTQSMRPAEGSMRPGGWQPTPGRLKLKRQARRGVEKHRLIVL